jgi:hypothetical protein
MKKTEGRKSRETVPLRTLEYLIRAIEFATWFSTHFSSMLRYSIVQCFVIDISFKNFYYLKGQYTVKNERAPS